MFIREHHQRTIDRLTALFQQDKRFPALIIGGSIAKGIATDTSDVDFLLVATDEEFARRQQTQDLGYFDTSLCDYPGGYVDGKIINRQFIVDVAERGSEPARWAFAGAIIAYSDIPDLADLIARAPVYQESEREGKMRSFLGQVILLAGYFAQEAEKRHDPYLMMQTTANLVLYAGRLILAYNRLLFPNMKRLMETLALAPEQPDGFLDILQAALNAPSATSAKAISTNILQFREWDMTPLQASVQYMQDTEWRWRIDRPDLCDR
ncbi:MAG TPA: nucleotidyltransferase domain-containing protein [Ktedonobacterales bacterium]|nr:nucleotidyltransferase domain-containing protein [Ktedonobacterales bacterium]